LTILTSEINRTIEPRERIVVAYARFVEDKTDGIFMQGVYFGGIANTVEEAERIAKECVNTTRGGTILPRLVAITGDDSPVLRAMEVAAERFGKLARQMYHAEEVIQRTQDLPHRTKK